MIRTRARLVAAVAVETAVGLVLAASALGRDSLWGDESATWDATGRSLSGTFEMIREVETNGSLFHLLVLGARRLLGDAEWVLRLPSAIAAVLTIPVAAMLANAVAGRRVAVLVGGLLAVHGSMIQYGRDGRTYALLVLLVTLSFLGLVADAATPRRWTFALWVLAGGAAFYVHLFAALALATQAATLHPWFGDPAARRRRVLGFAAMGVTMAPLLAVIVGRGELEGVTQPPIGLHILRDLAFAFSGGSWLVATTIGLLAAAAVLQVLRLGRGGDPEEARRLRLLVLWAAAPAAVGIVLSLPEQVLIARYVLPSLVPVVVLVSWFVAERVPWRAAGIAVVLGATAVGGAGAYVERNEDWGELTRVMVAESADGDGVVFLDDMLVLAVDYYLQDAGLQPPEPTSIDALVPVTAWGAFHLEDWSFPAVSRDEFLCAVEGRDRIWVIERDGIDQYEYRYRMLGFADERFGTSEVRYDDGILRLHLFSDPAPGPARSGC